ncbi:MAG: YraN family protein [Proteobacteria bacterium]|nr:YraN family protein [Pseudomonadota bacterium]
MSRKIGQLTEHLAALFLRLRGLRVIYKNYTCPHGEIDLIALHKEKGRELALIFVEVRYRSSEKYGSPAASIDEPKQIRLIRSAEYFVSNFHEYAHLPVRFDAVLLTRSGTRPYITWIKDAFDS